MSDERKTQNLYYSFDSGSTWKRFTFTSWKELKSKLKKELRRRYNHKRAEREWIGTRKTVRRLMEQNGYFE